MGFFRKRRKPEPEPEPEPKLLNLAQPMWYILIEAEVVGSTVQQWRAGSKVMVQTFTPGKRLEDTLTLLDASLVQHELRRIDTVRATRFDPGEDDSDMPGNYFQEPLEQASARNELTLGVFIVSTNTAWPADLERAEE